MALIFGISDKNLRFQKDAHTPNIIITEFIEFP